MNRSYTYNKGFTLVELSIVLVIIGLLIGGILAAQSMMETARVQSFVKKVNQFDVAVANFRTKYNGLPGDAGSMSCEVSGNNTCDDGLIEDGAYSITNNFSSETANFWPDMQTSGFTQNGTLTDAISGAFAITGTTVNSPQMPMGKNTGVIAYNNFNSPFDDEANYYAFADYSAITTSSSTIFSGRGSLAKKAFQPIEAVAIDTKIDDGTANTGNVLADSTCHTGGQYNSGTAGYTCILYVRMLSSQSIK